jgi:hypothetical protein
MAGDEPRRIFFTGDLEVRSHSVRKTICPSRTPDLLFRNLLISEDLLISDERI